MASAASPDTPPVASAAHLGQLAGFDGMRAIAAVGVLLFHSLWRTPALQPFGRVLGHGDIGVEIFFVMSGFLVARPVVANVLAGGKPVAFGAFWRKRIARIWPAYLVALVGALVVGVGDVDGIGGWLKHGLLIQTYFADRGGDGLKVSWTLVVEVGFYLVLLPLAALVARFGRRPLLAWSTLCGALLAAGAVGLAVTANGPTPLALRVLPPYLPAFAAGMLLAGAEIEAPGTGWSRRMMDGLRRLASRPTLCFGLALALFAAMVVLLPPRDVAPAFDLGLARVAQSFLQVVISFLALAPLALGSTGASWLERRALVTIGAASFGFYLWHIQVLRLLRPWLRGSDAVAFAAVVLAIIVATAAGVASRRVVEEPARRLLTRSR